MNGRLVSIDSRFFETIDPFISRRGGGRRSENGVPLLLQQAARSRVEGAAHPRASPHPLAYLNEKSRICRGDFFGAAVDFRKPEQSR